MQVTSGAASETRLHGEWVIAELIEQLRQLAGSLDLLIKADARPPKVTIDMAGVTSLDACGCQLLSAFLENLSGHGISTEPRFLAAQVVAQLRALGYEDAFADYRTAEDKTGAPPESIRN